MRAFRLAALALIAMPIAAQANYLGPNYGPGGQYIIRTPRTDTVITPQGMYTTTPINPQRPWAGSMTTEPGVFCTTHPNAMGRVTVCH